MDLSRLLAIFLLTTPKAVVLSVCTDVGGCLCPMISSVCRAGIASLQLMKRAPSSELRLPTRSEERRGKSQLFC